MWMMQLLLLVAAADGDGDDYDELVKKVDREPLLKFVVYSSFD